MGSYMNLKFEKYWSEYSLILGVAVILDPRYKLEFVEWGYNKLYGKDSRELKDVSGTLFSLYGCYIDKFSHLLVSNSVNQTPTQIKVGDKLFEEFDNIYQDGSTSNEKTELHLYLEEKRLDRKQELDILSWWKLEQFRYPVLSRMASDVLTIPISTVASESTFSISGRVLDQYRSSLLPETVQALLCTRDWLFGKGALEKEGADLEELTEEIFDMSLNENSGQCSNSISLD
ncbi:zinc finger BED domain-containing protein DAYSLEEPER-like [Malus sylvestris]|uniref:zinc finger BED domain-containing protein DAYSLEEPER-like n=1 Tax=Malus sylvestris TaxID=3752 RepID=UPI0021ACB6FC|nr:zinc finger BED domain-containing protein DAYSLEEPER-like [Malus sylvestris]